MQTRHDFGNSPEIQAMIDRIYTVMKAGMNPEKGRTWSSWKGRGASEHIRHAVVHMCNVHHVQNMNKIDRDTGLREIDHALTRMFFCVTLDDKAQKEAMRGMVEEMAE